MQLLLHIYLTISGEVAVPCEVLLEEFINKSRDSSIDVENMSISIHTPK